MKHLGNEYVGASKDLDTITLREGTAVTYRCLEFTCRCPITGQPDWATIDVEFTSGQTGIETKSLKLYLETWREVGIFHEALAAQVAHDIAAVVHVAVTVTVHFNVRGGIAVDASYTAGP